MSARRPSSAAPVVALLVLIAPVRAAHGVELTVDEALARARVSSPTVRAAHAAVAAAGGRLTEAGVWAANPVVSGQLARHTGPDSPDYVDREVALGQELEIGGQRGLRTAAARYEVARAEALAADAVRTVEAEVRRAFAALVAADRRRALADERASIVARLADAARRRARAGDAATLDVRLAEVEVVRAAQAIATADGDRREAGARLAAAIGAAADDPIVARAAADEDDAAVPIPDEAGAVARALASRPDLAAARAERARLTGEADLVRRERLVPNPTVRGFYRQEFGDEHIMGGEVAVPLPLWSRAVGTETATRAAASGAAVDVERLEREIPREVHVAFARHAAAAGTWERFRRDALPAMREADRLVEQGWTSGYTALSDALVQQDRLRDARAAAIDAWLALRTSEADVIEAVGGSLP